MPILTGRDRTVTWSGTASGTVMTETACVEENWLLVDSGTGIVQINGLYRPTPPPAKCKIIAGVGSNDPMPCDDSIRTVAHEFTFEVETGLGNTDTHNETLAFTGASADGTISTAWEAEWTITATVRERETIYDLADNDADGFPGLAILDGTNRVTGYSAGPKDHLHGRGIYWTEEIKPSTSVTVTMVCKVGGSTVATITATDTVSGAASWTLNYLLYMQAEAGGNTSAYGTDAFFQGVDLAGSGTTYTRTVSGQGSVSSAGGVSATGTGGVAKATLQIYPKIDYDFAGIIRKFDTAYDGSVTVQTDGRNGEPVFEDASTSSWSRTWSQLTYNYTSSIGVTAGTLVFDQGPAIDYRQPVRAWLSAASLSSAGEESTDMRLLFRGRRWNAYSVALAATIDLDTGDPTNWTAAANGSLSGTTETKITASGGTSGMSRAFDPAANSEAYRYMRLRVRASEAMTLRMKLTGRERVKNYRFDAGTSWANVDVDLMAPLNVVGRVHEQDTRWPLKPPGDAEEYAPIDEGWLFGVNWLTLLEIEGVPDGEWLEVDYVQMVRLTTPKLSFLPEFNNPVVRWTTSTPETTSDYRCVFADVDGKLSLDWFGLTKVQGPSSTSYSLLSLGTGSVNLASYIAGVPGWSVTTTNGPDAHHRLNDPAFWAGGSGATYDWSSELWSTWIEKDPSTALTVPAQALWDAVQVYPGAGDVWTSGDYDDPTKLRAAKFLRGRAFGITVEKGAALASQSVTLQEPTWSDVDAETTDSRGRYTTGSVHGDSALAHRVVWDDDGTDRIRDWTASEWVARRWHGASFCFQYALAGLAYDWHPSGKHLRARMEDSNAYFATSDNQDPLSFDEFDTGLSGEVLSACWLPTADGLKAAMLIASLEELSIYTTTDLGETWTLAKTFTTASDPKGAAICAAPDGRVMAYWQDGTTVKGAVMDAELTTLRDSASIRTGVDDGGLAAANFARGIVPYVGMLTLESGTPTLTESTDGLTFS